MNTLSQDMIICNAAAAAIEIIAKNTPLRATPVKSTFIVSPEVHRHLDIICKLTGKTRQEYFSTALKILLANKLYLDDIPIDKIKELY